MANWMLIFALALICLTFASEDHPSHRYSLSFDFRIFEDGNEIILTRTTSELSVEYNEEDHVTTMDVHDWNVLVDVKGEQFPAPVSQCDPFKFHYDPNNGQITLLMIESDSCGSQMKAMLATLWQANMARVWRTREEKGPATAFSLIEVEQADMDACQVSYNVLPGQRYVRVKKTMNPKFCVEDRSEDRMFTWNYTSTFAFELEGKSWTALNSIEADYYFIKENGDFVSLSFEVKHLGEGFQIEGENVVTPHKFPSKPVKEFLDLYKTFHLLHPETHPKVKDFYGEKEELNIFGLLSEAFGGLVGSSDQNSE